MFLLQKGVELFLTIAILTLWNGNAILAKESKQRVVCYYTNWSVYRPGTAKFTPQNINPYLCTHLIYSFGGFTKENTLKPYDKYQDIEQGGFAQFTGLKTYNKNLKTLLAIGGWNEGSSRFSPLVSNVERRNQFVKNTIKFLRQNHFDGLDLDWEYPTFRDGSKPKDRENYAQLVQELREEFEREAFNTGRPRLLLTMAVPAGIEYVDKGYDVPKLNKYLDWFNLLSYDYHSAYEPSVNHHSPLFSLEETSEYNYDSVLNIDFSVKFYLKAGADRDKLVLGIPTYGRSYTLYNPDATDIGAPADGPGEQGDATREKGYLAYYEICTFLKNNDGWMVVQPNSNAMGPYAFKGNQWVGFDDEAIAKRKAKYVVEQGLGGVMFWSIDNDDFRGTCHDKPYPIIEAAKAALLTSTKMKKNYVSSAGRTRNPGKTRSSPDSATRGKTDTTNALRVSFQPTASRKVMRPVRVTTTSATTSTKVEESPYNSGMTTTPLPPSTPDPGTDFKCEEEGFFPHPRDCKKYFWCLDSPSLGFVAHQFTCPSGLVFNKLADSCDYSRNVICSKTTSTPTISTTMPTTTGVTPITSTISRPWITTSIFRNRGIFTANTTAAVKPSLGIDSNEETSEVQSEEDPKVIKELIALIKKVGGVKELERQLQSQEGGSVLLRGAQVTDPVLTTTPSISKLLYERVLSHDGSVGQKFRSAITYSHQDKTSSLSENRLSSAVRNSYTNSRVGPQNAGLDQLPEFEGVFREKPKYVTLQRVRPTKATLIEERLDQDDYIDQEKYEYSTVTISKPTSVPKYVSIRRQRPSSVAHQEMEVIDDNLVSKQKPTLDRYLHPVMMDGSQTEASERLFSNRYNMIDRRRTTSVPSTISMQHKTDREDIGTDSSYLVRATDFHTIHTTSSTITNFDSSQATDPNTMPTNTQQYGGIERIFSRVKSKIKAQNSNIESSSRSSISNSGKSNGSNSSSSSFSSSSSSSSGRSSSSGDNYDIKDSITISSDNIADQSPDILAFSSGTNKFELLLRPEVNKTIRSYNGSADYSSSKKNLSDSIFEATDTPISYTDETFKNGGGVEFFMQGVTEPFGNKFYPNTLFHDTGIKASTNGEAFTTTAMSKTKVSVMTSVSSVPLKKTMSAKSDVNYSTNDATSVSNYKLTRTKNPLISTTTTTTVQFVTNSSRKATTDIGATHIPAKPRHFALDLRRARPKHLPGAKNELLYTSAINEKSTTPRFMKVSFSNVQRYDLSIPRQRRVGSATSESAKLLIGGNVQGDVERSSSKDNMRGNRGRVRFQTMSESLNSYPMSMSYDEPLQQVSKPFFSTTKKFMQTVDRRTEPFTGELAFNPFSESQSSAERLMSSTPSTVEPLTSQNDLGSLRRVNLNLYSGHTTSDEVKSTLTTEEPCIVTDSYERKTPEFKSFARKAEDPFQTQERILFTLGTALRYGYSHRDELRNDLSGSNVFLTELPMQELPMKSSNGTSMEHRSQFFADKISVFSGKVSTLRNVVTAEDNTTTPQPRQQQSSSFIQRNIVSSTARSDDMVRNFTVSEANTNRTFIPGRARPTRPSRIRTTWDLPLSHGTIPSEQETVTRSHSKKLFTPERPTERVFTIKFTSTSEPLKHDVIEETTIMSITKRQRVNRRRKSKVFPTSISTKKEDNISAKPRTLNTVRLNTRSRLLRNRLQTTYSPTPLYTETFTEEPTYPDSNAVNSDFTTIVTDTSKEIIPGEYDFFHNDSYLNMSNVQKGFEMEGNSSVEIDSNSILSSTHAVISPNLGSQRLLSQTKSSITTTQLPTDNQQLESESIPNRSSMQVFIGGVTRRKFTGKFVTTEEPEPTEPIKKFIPSRRNRPSFSLARSGRLSSTTEESLIVTTSDNNSVISNGQFIPSRKRMFGSRTSTTTTLINEKTSDDYLVSTTARSARRRPVYSSNRPPRPQSFENSFNKTAVTLNPVEQKFINRTSVLLPKRQILFLRSTTTASTTIVPILNKFNTTGRSILHNSFNFSDEKRQSNEENLSENEIQRQGKRLFVQFSNDTSNSLNAGTEKTQSDSTNGVQRQGFRYPPSVQLSSSSNRFIFKNNQPSDIGVVEYLVTPNTPRTFTTRSRRPFGIVGGYKPQNGTSLGGDFGVLLVGSVTTQRPRFTPTTRTRPTFGWLRSTTTTLSNLTERISVSLAMNDLEQGSASITRRYQPRKSTSSGNNLNAVGVTALPMVSNENLSTAKVFLKTTGTAYTTPVINKEKILALTEAAINTKSTYPHDNKNVKAILENDITYSNGTDEPTLSSLPSISTSSPTWHLETVAESENTTSYEDTITTSRTTTEYYTASDETHYTTLNTADTIYTINDNINIDDVNVLQDRSRTSSTTVKPTTLHHVFSIDKENEAIPSSTEIYRTEEQEIELPAANRSDKLVKIHRVVEIYTKNISNSDRIPIMQKLGEINRKITIRLVEANQVDNHTSSRNSNINSFTTTTLGGDGEASVTEQEEEDELDNGKANLRVLSSQGVFAMETSTIPLEGLFDPKKSGGLPTTELPPQFDEELVDMQTINPTEETKHNMVFDYNFSTSKSVLQDKDEEMSVVTQIPTGSDDYAKLTTLQSVSIGTSDFEHGKTGYGQKDKSNKPQHTTHDYDGVKDKNTSTTISEDTTLRRISTTWISSSTPREMIHKYTLPAEFSFREPTSETTTINPLSTTAATSLSTSPTITSPSIVLEIPIITSVAQQLFESTMTNHAQPSLVLPRKENKEKYTKRQESVLTSSRIFSDFSYSRDNPFESEKESVMVTTEPLKLDVLSDQTSLKSTRLYTNNRKYMSSVLLRPSLSTIESAQKNNSSSYRKPKEIPIVMVPKMVYAKTSMQHVQNTSKANIITTTTKTKITHTPIKKIDFNIKYVLPANQPNSHELKIESKNDKYSIPVSSILRPDFITHEISGERQNRQFSPVYRPELDNDEFTRQLTYDADPVALEAEHLVRQILGNNGVLGQQPVESVGTPSTAKKLVSSDYNR